MNNQGQNKLLILIEPHLKRARTRMLNSDLSPTSRAHYDGQYEAYSLLSALISCAPEGYFNNDALENKNGKE